MFGFVGHGLLSQDDWVRAEQNSEEQFCASTTKMTLTDETPLVLSSFVETTNTTNQKRKIFGKLHTMKIGTLSLSLSSPSLSYQSTNTTS